jgi:pantoate--beta-alanine ligase
MLQATGRQALRQIVDRWKSDTARIALVPTMGNLHDGHLALVRAARSVADCVVASIYVNPTQFGEGEDFKTYPRTLENDIRLLSGEGCDLLFAPDESTMYPFPPDKTSRLLAAPDLSDILEGKFRPGHFDGVVTAVSRLFNLVRPDIAVFGEKDFQQLIIVQRMVDDLGYGTQILPVATVREESGLAMSSRNVYLDSAQQQAAACLSRILLQTAEQAAATAADFRALEEAAARELSEGGLRVEYVAVRQSRNLAKPAGHTEPLRVLAAVRCGNIRLIDNCRVGKKN